MSEIPSQNNQEIKSPVLTVHRVFESIEQDEKWAPEFNRFISDSSNKERVVHTLEHALNLYNNLEVNSKHPLKEIIPLSGNIKFLWTVSGSGTYLKAGHPEDHPIYYQDRAVDWSDRQRMNYSILLGNGIQHAHGYTPTIRYESNPYRTQDLRQGLLSGDQVSTVTAVGKDGERSERTLRNFNYPSDKLWIPDIPNIRTTIDNIRAFSVPPNVELQDGEEMGIVTNVPHFVRLMFHMNKEHFEQKIPKGVNIRAFPLPTNPRGRTTYPLQEMRALINYAYMREQPLAAETPFPLILNFPPTK